MRKLLLMFVAMPVFGYSQISEAVSIKPDKIIGKISAGFRMIAQLSYNVQNGDTTYMLTFDDNRYTAISSIEYISFSGVDDTKEKFYDLLMSVFNNKKNRDYNKVFTLGGQNASVFNYKGMAAFETDGAWVAFTKGQINKLFGK